MKAKSFTPRRIVKYGLMILLCAVVVAVTICFPVPAQTPNVGISTTQILLNGTSLEKRVLFFEGSGYLPIRDVSEMMEFEAAWDETSHTIILNKKTEKSDEIEKLKAENAKLKEDIRKMEEVRPEGRWKGIYYASQGETGVVITFQDLQEGQGFAEFEMVPLASNPDVPAGSFQMKVSYDAQTKVLDLKADRWIIKPANYAMVDFIGTVGGNSMGGVVTYKDKIVGHFALHPEE